MVWHCSARNNSLKYSLNPLFSDTLRKLNGSGSSNRQNRDGPALLQSQQVQSITTGLMDWCGGRCQGFLYPCESVYSWTQWVSWSLAFSHGNVLQPLQLQLKWQHWLTPTGRSAIKIALESLTNTMNHSHNKPKDSFRASFRARKSNSCSAQSHSPLPSIWIQLTVCCTAE